MDVIAEQRCIEACRAGNTGAFRALVDAYWARSVRLAWALVGDPEDARDVAQEAFVAAYRALPQHAAGRPFYPWLRGILVNRAKVFVRTRNRARARRERAAQRPGHWSGACERGASEPARELVQRGLAELDAGDRELIVLKHLEGYTYDELAQTLGIPRGTVMSRLYRARRRLRRVLERLDPTLLKPGGAADDREAER